MIALALAAVLAADPAPAEGAPPEAPQLLVLPLEDFRHLSVGPLLDVEIGTGLAGYHLAGDLGVQTFLLASHQRRWLLSWDVALAARAGGLANTHTNLLFVGGAGRAAAEADYRFAPDASWSPYLGAGAGAALTVMAHPGVALDHLDTINAPDGFGGVMPSGAVRPAGGSSFLTQARALQVGLFVQEWLRGAQIVTPFGAFSEVGLAARYDVAGSLSLQLEGLYGVTPANAVKGLDASDQTARLELDARARWTFRSRWWVGAFLSLSQENDHLTYAATKTTYSTWAAPTFVFSLAVGLPLGGEP